MTPKDRAVNSSRPSSTSPHILSGMTPGCIPGADASRNGLPLLSAAFAHSGDDYHQPRFFGEWEFGDGDVALHWFVSVTGASTISVSG